MTALAINLVGSILMWVGILGLWNHYFKISRTEKIIYFSILIIVWFGVNLSYITSNYSRSLEPPVKVDDKYVAPVEVKTVPTIEEDIEKKVEENKEEVEKTKNHFKNL